MDLPGYQAALWAALSHAAPVTVVARALLLTEGRLRILDEVSGQLIGRTPHELNWDVPAAGFGKSRRPTRRRRRRRFGGSRCGGVPSHPGQGRAGAGRAACRGDGVGRTHEPACLDASHRRDYRATVAYCDLAIEHAREHGDAVAAAHTELRKGFAAMYGQADVRDPTAGLASAQIAAEQSRSVSYALSGLSLLHVGEAYAMLGEYRRCERALS